MMNAHDASTANTNNAARALKPVDRPSGVAPAADAFKALEAEYAKLPNDKLTAINVDIPRAVAVVLGAEPRLRSLLPAMEATMKSPPTALVESIRQMALGAWYAHLVTMRARSDGSVKELLERGTVLRAKLLKAADALADAELVDGAAVIRIRDGAGNIDKANDLVALAAMFSQSWDAIHDKTAITREQVDEAALLGPRLLLALAEDPLPKPDHANDMRQRAFTLLVRSYDEIRRAVVYVRWAEGDADAFAPSLYTKSRKLRASGVERIEDGTDDAVVAADLGAAADA